jgi:hypothetical protein
MAECSALLLTAALLATGREPGRHARAELDNIDVSIVDGRGGHPGTGEAPVFEARRHRPVTTPARRPVSYGEFMRAAGDMQARCEGGVTTIRVRLHGLIPGGDYSLWSFVFDPPGRTPSLAAATGAGALGAGRAHIFTASREGEAYVALTVPGGPRSGFGSSRGCELDEFEWKIVGAYHLDGARPDVLPTTDGSVVEQFGFTFRRGTARTR